MAEPTKVHVPLGERAYDILIGSDLLETAGERLKAMFPGRRFGIVTDTEVAKAQMPRLTRSLSWRARRFFSLSSMTRNCDAHALDDFCPDRLPATPER